MDRIDRVLHALRDTTRRRLLDLLRDGPRTTGELCAAVPRLSRVNVIKHLKLLETVGLVRVEPRGRERWNHLNVVPLQEVYERWMRPFEAQWAGRLWRLREVVERGASGMGTAMDADAVRLVRIEQEVRIEADQERVWLALTGDPGAWWIDRYAIRKDRVGLRLDLRVGGIMWEDWGDGQGWTWGVVRGLRRPHVLELSGTFMLPGAVDGSATFDLTDDAGVTVLSVRQTAIGAITESAADEWRDGWADLLGVRLKAVVEAGAP